MNEWAYDPAFVMRKLRHGEAPALPQGQLALQCWGVLGASPEVTSTPSLSCCTAQGSPEFQEVCQACAGLLQDRSKGIAAPPRQRPWAMLEMTVGLRHPLPEESMLAGGGATQAHVISDLSSSASLLRLHSGLITWGQAEARAAVQQALEVAGPRC